MICINIAVGNGDLSKLRTDRNSPVGKIKAPLRTTYFVSKDIRRSAAPNRKKTRYVGSLLKEHRNVQKFQFMGAIGKRLIPTMSHTEQANCSHLLSICAQSVVPAIPKVEFAPSNPLDQVFDFIDLLDAYRPYGGLSRMQGLLAGGRVRCDGQDRLVKDLVDSGELIAFSWHDAVWMPMFQFDMLGLGVEPKPHAIVTTFGFGYDGWAVASWFVQPNPWLESQFPIECLGSRLSDVMYAARSHHFTKVR